MWLAMESANPSVFVNSTEAGVQRVRDSGGKYAFLTNMDAIDYYSSSYPCDTVRAGENIYSVYYGVMFPLNSPWK